MSLDSVLARIDADIEKSTDRLLDLLRIRSISTDPAYAEDCQKAADWLVRDLESLGAVATKRQTPGHPMVVGHVDGAGHISCFTDIMMCNLLIPLNCGIVIRLILPLNKRPKVPYPRARIVRR